MNGKPLQDHASHEKLQAVTSLQCYPRFSWSDFGRSKHPSTHEIKRDEIKRCLSVPMLHQHKQCVDHDRRCKEKQEVQPCRNSGTTSFFSATAEGEE